MAENRFEKISVSAIVKRAEVARTTFYAHFDSKEQLLLSLREPIDNVFLAELETQYSSDAFDFEALAITLFKAMYDNRAIFQLIDGTDLDLLILAQTRNLMQRAIARAKEFDDVSESEPTPYLDEPITGVLFALTCWWVRDGMKLPIEEIAKVFVSYGSVTRQMYLASPS
ncbi:MAG: TetR/AcrR family transcriptional regulator [Chloroflexota bacterium]